MLRHIRLKKVRKTLLSRNKAIIVYIYLLFSSYTYIFLKSSFHFLQNQISFFLRCIYPIYNTDRLLCKLGYIIIYKLILKNSQKLLTSEAVCDRILYRCEPQWFDSLQFGNELPKVTIRR